jgi:hypothetical protein
LAEALNAKALMTFFRDDKEGPKTGTPPFANGARDGAPGPPETEYNAFSSRRYQDMGTKKVLEKRDWPPIPMKVKVPTRPPKKGG